MKKLMIAAAIVCAAVASQAASIAWSLTGDGEESIDRTVYIVSAVSEFEDLAAVQAAVLPHDSGDVSATIESQGRLGGETAVGSVVNSAWESKDTVDFYYVIISDDNGGYWTSGKQTASVAKGTGTPSVSSLGTLSTITASEYTPWAVPEPTSGLLLLLGMAGLALKRKRA